MMKNLALVMRARFFYNPLFLWIVNNYSRITLLEGRDLDVAHRRIAEA